MATTAQNIIRTLTIRSTVEGADKTKADLKGIQSAHEGVARVTDTSAKNQLSLADAVAKSERRFNASIRAQQDFEKVQRQMNLAVAQNPALQARANAVLALAAQHFDQASSGQRAFATAMRAANDNLRGFAQSAGPVGSVLAAMGPGGIAAAAGIGATVIALHQMITAATNLADRAGKLKDFAETTGFTVIELQALEKAGAQVGVSAESVSKGLERFSAQMADVKLQTGETFEKLLAVNPVLARQVAEANSLSKAYELVSKAIKGAGIEQGNQLARAFFGRGGVEQTRLMRVVGGDAGMKGVIDDLKKVDVITAQQAERWDTLGDKIAENMKAAKQNIASIFTEPVLLAAERFSKAFLDLSREMKQFEVSERLQKVMDFFSNPVVQGAMAGALAGARGGLVGAAVGAAAGGGAAALFSHADATQAAEDVAKLRFELEQLQLVKAGASRKVLESVDPAQVQQYAAILERTNQRIAEIQKQMPQELPRITVTANAPTKGYESDAEGAARAAEQLRIATIASYNEMARWMSVIGGAATLAERYELTTRKLSAAKAEGKINEEQYARAIADQKEKLELSLGVANMAAITEERLRQVREVSAKAGLSDEQTRLAVQIAMVEAKDRERQAWRRANPEMAQAVDYAESLAKSLVNVAMGVGTISDAFKSLAGTLASDSIRSLFKGDLLAAGLQAVGAAVMAGFGAFFDDAEAKRLEQAKLKFAEMGAEVRNFNAAADGFELSQFVTAIQQITRTGIDLIKAAMAAGDTAAAIQLIHNGVRQINNQVDQFIRPRGNTVADQIAAVNNEAQQIIGELNAMNQQFGLGLNRTTEILGAAAERVAEIQRKAEEEIEKRRLTFQDRVFAAANDNNSLAGQLAAFDRAAMREIIEERDVGGQAMIDLERAQLAERANIVRDFNDRAISESKRAAQEQLDAHTRAAKGILDYINNQRVGPDSSFSPTAKLSAAQATYNATLGLAQGGNIDALGRVTQDFENLRKAAQEVYASSAAYQNILNAGINQLLALPAVQTSTDPVVQQLLAVQQAIQATTTAVGGTTTAVGGTTNAVITDTAATVAKLDVAIARFVDAVNLLSATVGRLDASNALLTAIHGLESTAAQQLLILKTETARSATINFTAVGPQGQEVPASVNNESMIDQLKKIVANTYAISINTANAPIKLRGVYAEGGWITGGTPGRDSVPIMAMPHEFVVNADATRALTSQFGNGIMDMINAGRLPTNVIPFPTPSRSNESAIVAELREVRRELAETKRELAKVIAGSAARGAQATVETGERIVEATDRQTDKLETVERQKMRARA